MRRALLCVLLVLLPGCAGILTGKAEAPAVPAAVVAYRIAFTSEPVPGIVPKDTLDGEGPAPTAAGLDPDTADTALVGIGAILKYTPLFWIVGGRTAARMVGKGAPKTAGDAVAALTQGVKAATQGCKVSLSIEPVLLGATP